MLGKYLLKDLYVPALKTGLSEAFIEALAEGSSGDFRMEFARDAAVPVALEGRVRPPARRKQM